MPIPPLAPSAGTIDVQRTTFSIDVLGRFICSTWEEATANSGPPFSAVVIGGGMYGAYLAAKIFRRHQGKRVLLLDAGRFLVGEHVQNLGSIGLNVAAAIPPSADLGVAATSCGVCRGEATLSSLDWRTASGASRCTGAVGARVLPAPI